MNEIEPHVVDNSLCSYMASVLRIAILSILFRTVREQLLELRKKLKLLIKSNNEKKGKLSVSCY